MPRLKRPRPVGTLTYSLDLPGDPLWLGVGPDGRLEPLLHRSTLDAAREGYTVETRELWTADGRLLSWNTQTVVVIEIALRTATGDRSDHQLAASVTTGLRPRQQSAPLHCPGACRGRPEAGFAVVALRGVQFGADICSVQRWPASRSRRCTCLPRNPEGDFASVTLGLAVFGLALVVGLLLHVAYWVWLPMRLRGRTLAMVPLRLRVVGLDRGPVAGSQMGLRWLLLLADALFFGLVGLVSMLATPRRQRLGDLMAQTLVIRETK